MKRFLLVLSAMFLLAWMTNVATADYLIIKVDINNLNFKTDNKNPGPVNLLGNMGTAGKFGAKGAFGAKGGGMMGYGGMPGGYGGMPGGMMGKGGAQGMMGGMMGMGMKGGGGMGGMAGAGGMKGGGMMGMMGNSGMPGGMAGNTGMPGGAMGKGVGAFGAAGAAGNYGALGGMNKGSFGIQGAMGNKGATGSAGAAGAAGNTGIPVGTPTPKNTPLWVSAYVELKGLPEGRGAAAEIAHRWGSHTYVPLYNKSFEYQFIRKELPIREFKKRFDKDSKDPAKLLTLAAWAWSHRLEPQFEQAMTQLKKIDPKNPAVARFDTINEFIKTPFSEGDAHLEPIIKDFQKKDYRVMLSERGHYTLLTKLASNASNDPVLKRRLNQMEDTFDSFYYWFTFQDNVPLPPMPKKRLLAVLVNDVQEFHDKHEDWGNAPMIGSGFMARRDNVLVIASKRLDPVYQALEKNNQYLAGQLKLTRDELVDGKVWDRPEVRETAMAVAMTQTMHVVQKSLEEESERATISHEGTRQLLAATGILPRNVQVPEWLEAGLASYFETPFGAPYPGAGIPSWSNLIAFKLHRPTLGSGRDALYNTITDRYFHQAHQASIDWENNRENVTQFQKAHEDWERARATAWALTYYLIQTKRFPALIRYTKEVATMPRDLALDERALEAHFATAFDLADTKNRRRFDEAKFSGFAQAWFREMENVILEIPEIESEALRNILRLENPEKKDDKKSAPPPP